MNLEKLQQLQRDNRAAQTYFHTLSGRYRSFKQNTVQDVIDIARRADVMVSPTEVLGFFEGLEAADCGRLVGEGDSQHFVWIVKGNQIAHLLSRHKDDLASEAPIPEGQATSAEMPAASAASAPVALVSHPLRLRNDLLVELQLPADLSAGEARRLCHFILALTPDNNE